MTLRAAAFAALVLAAGGAPAQPLLTYAGGGTDDGKPATSIAFHSTNGIALDANGNVYVVDGDAGLVRKIDAASGLVSTVAGDGRQGFTGDDGPAKQATFRGPQGVVLDAAGNVYIADKNNDRVRRVAASTGLVDTFAGGGRPSDGVGDGGPATAASVLSPWGLALDGKGSLFIAEYGGNRIRRVDIASGIITTVAGNGTQGFSGDGGPATSASLSAVVGVAVDGAGNLYIADAANNRVRRVAAQTHAIDTLAGNGSTEFGANGGDGGSATAASLSSPTAVAVDAAGANVFILDSFHRRVRKVSLSSNNISTVAGGGDGGDGVPATQASLGYVLLGLTVNAAGDIFISDGSVRKVPAATGLMSTIAGGGTYAGDGGPATAGLLHYPQGLAIDPKTGDLLIADSLDLRVRDVAKGSKAISTIVGDGTYGTLAYPVDVAADSAGNVYVALANGGTILRRDAQTGAVTTFAGGGSPADGVGDGGPATSARLDEPRGVAVDSAGNVYVGDTGGNRIRRVDAATHVITTVAGTGLGAGVYAGGGFSGDGGPATAADLNGPIGVVVDSAGNLFFADNLNSRIRRVDKATGVITTVAGSGPAGYGSGGFGGDGGLATGARLSVPTRVALDAAGNLFIADTGNVRVRRVDKATGVITTIAGNGQADYGGEGGLATSSALNEPLGVAVDGAGDVFISDAANNLVRIVPTSGCALPVIGVQPRSQTIVAGFAAVLTVSATGATSFQWYRGLAGDTSNPVAGATSSSFTTPPLAATTPYFCRATNACGSVDSGAATVTVATELADLSLAMDGKPEPVPVGGRLAYTLTARNNGPTQAQHVVVTDSLPAGFALVSSSATQGSCSGNATVTCALGTLVQGAEAKVTLAVTPSQISQTSNRARVSSDQPDPNESDNSAILLATVSPATSADVSISASASPDPVRVGQTVTATLFVANNGPAGATNVVARATLPGGAALVSSSALLGSCSGNGPVTCNLGTLAAGASTTATLVLAPSVAGTLRSDVTVTAAQDDPSTANNGSSFVVTVLSNTAACPAPPPDVVASPQGVVRAGDSFTVSWTDVYGPTDSDGVYRVQLASATDFSAASLLADLTTRNLSASFPTSASFAGTLSFRITSVAGCGQPGAYSTTVSINVAPNPPSLVVTQAQTPEWVVSAGALPPAATLKFKNVGGSSTPVEFRPAGGFFTLSPSNGILAAGQEVTVTLTALPGSTANAGTQAGSVTAEWSTGSAAASVYLTVASTTSSGSRPTVDQDEVLLIKPLSPGGKRPLAVSQSSVTITNTGTQPIFLVPSVEPGGAWLKLSPAEFSSPLPPSQTRVITLGSDPALLRPSDYPLPIWTVLTISAAGGASTDRVQVKVFFTEESAVVSGAGRGFLSGSARSFIVPTAVHKSGVGGALFTSDGWLRNLSPDPATFDVFVTPSGQDGQVNASKVTQTIPGFSTVRLFDFIQALFGSTDLAGPVEIRSADAAQLSVRTSANGLPGTGDATSRYGTEIAVYGAGTGTGVGLAPLVLTGLKDDAANRLNLILTETTGTAATVRLRLFDSGGTQLATQDVAVPAAGNIQFRLIQKLGIPDAAFEEGSLVVEPLNGTGRVVALGTVIDNVSQSFQGLTGRALTAAAAATKRPLAGALPPRVIPSIVHASGIGAFFVTELSITNGTAAPASLHLVYTYAGSASGVATADVTLAPRASLPPSKARDAVVSLFGLPAGSSTAGSLRIEGAGLSQIVARATVTTPVSLTDSSKGTKGSEFQSYSSRSPEAVGLDGTRVVIYPGLQKFAGIRTNLILAEVGGQPVHARLRAIDGATGGVLAQIDRTFAAYERVQINDIWNGDGGFGVGVAALDKVAVSLEPLDGAGHVVGALAVIDNVTNSSKILVMAPPGPPDAPSIGF